MGNIELQLFRKTLKNSGYFNTRARYDLFLALQNHASLPATKLVKLLKKQGETTVYRNLKLFEELGIISILQLGWNSRLELSDRFHHHHHHLSCTNCHKVFVLKENPSLERIIAKISHTKGFKPTDHQLEIRGLCAACQK